VKTRSGMTLAPVQVEGIVHLVSSAVEGLEPGNVTIVDTSGKVLFKRTDSSQIGQMTTTQFEYQRNVEEGMKRKVQGMLEEVLGPNKAIARISTEVDFQQVDITEEKYDPTGVLRSEQKNAEKSSTTQVQASSTEPREGSLELKGSDPKKGASPDNLKVQSRSAPPPVNLSSAERENEVRNYEISKVNKHIRTPVGKLIKVSAAVVVDGTYKGSGKSRAYVPRSSDEMKNLENIVKKAVGYNEERKDQVEVINMPFYGSVLEEETKEEKPPVWKEYFQIGYKPVISLILAFLFIFFVVKPLLKKRNISPGAGESPVLQSVAQTTLPQQMAEAGQERRAPAPVSYKDQTLQIATGDPSKAARVVKTWLQEKE